MKAFLYIGMGLVIWASLGQAQTNAPSGGDAGIYAVVVSPATMADPAWAEVARALQAKHGGKLVVVPHEISALRDALRAIQPRYVGLVARPEELDERYVRRAHQVARVMNGDPYEDFMWGIVTGATARDALGVVQTREELVVRDVVSTTGVHVGVADNLFTISDEGKGAWRLEAKGVMTNGVTQTGSQTAAFRDFIQRHAPDALVTSGHGSPFNIELSFNQGAMVCGGGRMFLIEPGEFRAWVRQVGAGSTDGRPWYQAAKGEEARAQWAAANADKRLDLSTRPRVLLAAANCLVGNVRRTGDSLVPTLLGRHGFRQIVAYTIMPQQSEGGWQTLDLWTSAAGCNSLAEASHLATQGVILRMLRQCPGLQTVLLAAAEGKEPDPQVAMRTIGQLPTEQQKRVLEALHDLDGLVLYGDPKWRARLGGQGAEMQARWKAGPGGWDLEVETPRPFPGDVLQMFLLPERRAGGRVVERAGLTVTLTDDFVAIEKPAAYEAGQKHVVRIEAKPASGADRQTGEYSTSTGRKL